LKKLNLKTKILGAIGVAFGAIILSSCTANFCTDKDKAYIAYPYEQGVTVYCSKEEVPSEYLTQTDANGNSLAWQPLLNEGNTDLWAYIPVDETGYSASKASLINSTISTCKSNGYIIPSYDYYKGVDDKLLNAAIEEAIADGIEFSGIKVTKENVTASQLNPFSSPDCLGDEEGVTANYDSILRNYGFLKFVTIHQEESTWYSFDFGNWEKWNLELAETLGSISVPTSDYASYYKTVVQNKVASIRSCITTKSGSRYGHYGDASNWQIQLETYTWGDAWSKGFLEGLIIYPVSVLLDSLTFAIDPALSGFGQVISLIITTLIVRAVVVLLTLKSTIDQQKMQLLQPQIKKIQAKYPNSNENQAQKMRLQQETAALYKRNKVSMLSSFITLIVQFPVFICVWGALQGNAAMSSGSVLNLRLSDTISTVVTNFNGTWYANTNGWWTAAVLFVVMAAIQFLAMKLPQWMTKRRTKDQVKLTANPAEDKNGKTMKYVSIFMLIFTIIMGFSLPSAMCLYWAIGGLISMLQTVIIQSIMAKRLAKQKERK